jgi:hypothetical protein
MCCVLRYIRIAVPPKEEVKKGVPDEFGQKIKTYINVITR